MRGPVLKTRRRTALAAACLSALALAACSDDPASDAQVALSLASVSSGSGTTLEARGADAAAAAGEVTSTITLPAGPSSGSVYRPSTASVTTERVNALAQSLGIEGAADERAGGWVAPAGSDPATVSTSAPRLIVLKDDVGSWFFGTSTTCDLSTAGTGSSCATSSEAVAVSPPTDDGGTTDASPTPTSCSITEQERQAAQDLAQGALGAVGATGGTSATDPQRCSVTVIANTAIDGRSVDGLTTSVTATATSSGPVVTDAGGTLATWSADGDPLPLVDAATGLERLNALPQPAIAELCQPATKGDGCLTTSRTVESADAGLMRDTDLATGTAIVVPAWTFTLRTTLLEPDGTPAPQEVQPTGTSTVSVTALDDSVLATAAPTTPSSGDVPPPDDGAGGGTSPGSSGSGGADPAVPPADPGVGGIEPLPATAPPVPVDVPEQRGTAIPDPAAP